MDRSVRIPLFHFLTGSRDIEQVFQELGFSVSFSTILLCKPSYFYRGTQLEPYLALRPCITTVKYLHAAM